MFLYFTVNFADTLFGHNVRGLMILAHALIEGHTVDFVGNWLSHDLWLLGASMDEQGRVRLVWRAFLALLCGPA